jgi:predicted HicB family RNase H-like nuclease
MKELNRIRVNITLAPTIIYRAKLAANKKNISLSQFINECLESFLITTKQKKEK